MVIKDGRIYFTLKEVAPTTAYSADYLRIRILQKKLKGVKIGREWYTTKPWIAEYVATVAIKKPPVLEITEGEEGAEAHVPEKIPESVAKLQLPQTEAFPSFRPPPEPVAIELPRFTKSDLKKLPDFAEFLQKLRGAIPAKLLAIPLVAGLAFLFIYPVATGRVDVGQIANRVFETVGSFALESKIPRPQDIPGLAAAAAGRAISAAVTLPGKLAVAAIQGILSADKAVAKAITSVRDLSAASIFDAIRNFFSALAERFSSEKIAEFLGLIPPPQKPEAKIAPALTLNENIPSAPGVVKPQLPPTAPISSQTVVREETRQVRAVIETREVVRPADVSMFQTKLAELDKGLRGQVSKLVTDVAALYTISDQKTTIVTSFAPSQNISQLQSPVVKSGLDLKSGNLDIDSGNLTVTGNAFVSGTLSVPGGISGGSLSTSGLLGVNGTGTSTFAYGLTAATSGGMIGFGTSSPSRFLSINGDTYLTGGLGVGTATNSPGGLQTSGAAVIGTNLTVGGALTVNGTATTSIAGPLVVQGTTLTISATSTITSQFTVTRVPILPHTFAAWSIGAANSNVTDASLLVNSLTAAGDTNLFGIAVNGSARLLVDAEGDIFANSITLSGGSSVATTSISQLTVENGAVLGDAANSDTHIIRGATTLYATTSAPALTIWNSDSGDLLRLQSEPSLIRRFVFTSTGAFGIGTSTPGAALAVHNASTTLGGPVSIQGPLTLPYLQATSSTASYFMGSLGIGTSTPSAANLLSVHGPALINGTSTIIGGVLTPSISATSSLGIYTGGAQAPRVYVDSSGRIGINTTQTNLESPGGSSASSYFLSIKNGTTDNIGQLLLQQGNTSDGWGFLADQSAGNLSVIRQEGGTRLPSLVIRDPASSQNHPQIGIFTTTPDAILTLQGTSTQPLFDIYTSSSVSAMYVSSAGLVGIGTTSPGALLSVDGPALIKGTSTIMGGVLTPSIVATGTLGIYTGGSVLPTFEIIGLGRAVLDGPNSSLRPASIFGMDLGSSAIRWSSIYSASINLSPNGGTAASTISFSNTGNSATFGIDNSTANGLTGGSTNYALVLGTQSARNLHLYTNNSIAATINASGLVGIGTTSPWGLLSVEHIATSSANQDLPSFVVSSQGTSTPDLLVLNRNGFVGVATRTPGALFSVHGPELINGTSTIMGGVLTPSISATSSLGIYTGGAAAPRVVVDSSGNVGIATTSPSSPSVFGISGTAYISGALGISQTTAGICGSCLTVKGQTILDFNGNILLLRGDDINLGFNTRDNTRFTIRDTNANSLNMTFMPFSSGGGFIGIGNGTATPSGMLSVAAPSGTSTPALIVNNAGTGELLTLQASGATKFKVQNDGTVGISTSSPGAFLAVHNGSLDLGGVATIENSLKTGYIIATSSTANTFASSLLIATTTNDATLTVGGPALIKGTSTIMGGVLTPSITATGTLGIYTGGAAAPRVYVDSSGNVGIGTTTPWGTLSVSHVTSSNNGGTVGSSILPAFVVSDTGTSTPSFVVLNQNGFVGVATRTPGAQFSVDVGANQIILNGSVRIRATGETTTAALCGSGATGAPVAAGTMLTITDCSGAPVQDYAEMYPTDSSIDYGDIVAPDPDHMTVTMATSQFGTSTIAALEKSSHPYQQDVVGVVSNNYNDFTSTGYNSVQVSDHPLPVALNGRLPVKVSTEGGAIAVGDPITTSSLAGIGMKATSSGETIGIALASFDGSEATSTVSVNGQSVRVGKILVFLKLGYTRLGNDLAGLSASSTMWSVDAATGRLSTTFGLDLKGSDLVNVRSVLSANGSWSISESGELVADAVVAKSKLQVGSLGNPHGITLYDFSDGKPYCVFVQDGVLRSVAGECTFTSASAGSSNAQAQISNQIQNSNDQTAATNNQSLITNNQTTVTNNQSLITNNAATATSSASGTTSTTDTSISTTTPSTSTTSTAIQPSDTTTTPTDLTAAATGTATTTP